MCLCAYVYIYVLMCICICLCVCMCVCRAQPLAQRLEVLDELSDLVKIHKFADLPALWAQVIFIYMHIMYICVNIYICSHAYIYMNMCMFIHIYLYLYVCTYIHVYI